MSECLTALSNRLSIVETLSALSLWNLNKLLGVMQPVPSPTEEGGAAGTPDSMGILRRKGFVDPTPVQFRLAAGVVTLRVT